MKLSIITINLNNVDGLRTTIESVLSQTFSDYELLVIDGVSTDGSVDVIKEKEAHIAYWLSEPDKGIYNAMNKAIIRAKGEYCYFLNSGDYLASETTLEKIFDETVEDSFICGNFITNKRGETVKNTDYRTRDWGFSLYDVFSGFLAHQAFFIKKEMFDKYGLYDERLQIVSDWKLFFIAIGIHNEKVGYKDVDISVYDMDGLSSRIGGKAIYAEKMKVAKEELSDKLYKKLDRLYFLERNSYIVDFTLSKQWIYFLFRVFHKIAKVFGSKKC